MANRKQTNEEVMINSLQSVKNEDEEIKCAIHGILLVDGGFTAGYFGMTDKYLVIALPGLDGKNIVTKANILLSNIEQVDFKKAFFSRHIIMTIKLNDGKAYGIRAAQKVYGIPAQKDQLEIFIDIMSHLGR